MACDKFKSKDVKPDDVNQKVAEIIKRELERGKIIIDEKITEEQQDEAVKEKLRAFNDFIRRIRELGGKPPKSSQTDEYLKYQHRLDELIYTWKDLLDYLPRFTRDELKEFIGREVRGGESRERCFDVALIIASRDDPLSFNEIAKSARLLKSFTGLKETSLNKTLSRILESLKRAGLIVKAKYYFRLFNLENDEGSKNLMIAPRGGDGTDIEKYLARILKEISNLREIVDRMNERLKKQQAISDSFTHRLRKLSED